jgi:hypothetical protein
VCSRPTPSGVCVSSAARCNGRRTASRAEPTRGKSARRGIAGGHLRFRYTLVIGSVRLGRTATRPSDETANVHRNAVRPPARPGDRATATHRDAQNSFHR